MKGGRKPARMASLKLAPALGSQVPGTEIAATERREALPCASISRRSGKQAAAVTKVRLSALRLPSKGEKKLKAKLARWREDEAAWLFEI